MKPQFPYKVQYTITQGYDANLNNYPEGHHGGLDIVPFDNNQRPFPADIYPVFSGKTISVANTDPKRGKGIKVRAEFTDQNFINYLKENNVVPKNYSGKILVEILDWHCLEVTDLDGTIDQKTPVAKTGNTGLVYSLGKPVPDWEKGQPPYRGLHNHHEHVLKDANGKLFNLDKDPKGRINPLIIFNYKGANMTQIEFVHVEGTQEYGFLETTTFTKVYHRAVDENYIKELARGFQLNIFGPDGKIDFSKARDIRL